ncbi:MAG: GAF domain-containing sensor histidine kinase [Candidatus Daviesbacteria bacterium]|nr:GAF domain-containing sensor histidine kinase [Candidatus Daviesbacteria bacterium]
MLPDLFNQEYFLASNAFLIFLLAIILSLYISFRRKTQDLQERNRKLSALRKLDQVMMSYYTDLEEVAQKITDAFALELGYENITLLVLDEKRRLLKSVAMSNLMAGSKRGKIEIPLSDSQNIAVQTVLEGQVKLTQSSQNVFIPLLEQGKGGNLNQVQRPKTTVVHPIKARNKVIGAMSMTLNKASSLDVHKENMEELLDVIGASLNNAILYQDLKVMGWHLAEANKKMQDLDQMKDDFVSVTSHELKTPMTAIRSYAWMALNKSDVVLSDRLKKYLVRVLISTERLINLVNDLLNISRIESGRIEINPESVDLISLSKDILDEIYYSKSTQKNINFVLLEQKLPKVFADGEKLRQVFLNLAGNAVKFSPEGGKIAIGFFTDGKIVETYIKDEGPGIDQEDLGRLFTKFGRLDSSYEATAATGGSGLGLYISKNLIELMHGRIWAESEGLGKGTIFKFSLPIATEEVLAHPEQFKVRPKGEAKGLEPAAMPL